MLRLSGAVHTYKDHSDSKFWQDKILAFLVDNVLVNTVYTAISLLSCYIGQIGKST